MVAITDSRIRDLTGEKFGRWLVLEYAGKSKAGHQWLCLCECEKTRNVLGSNLKKRLSKSCGCMTAEKSHRRMVDLTGKKFGKLKVLEYSHTNDKPQWLCICDCGNQTVVNGGSLKRGTTASCGCGAIESRTTHGLSSNPKEYYQYLMSDPFRKLRSKVSLAVTKNLKKRNSIKNGSILDYLSYSILELKEHLEKQFEPWMSWDNYGGRSNSSKKTWWIDHIKPQSEFQYTSMSDKSFQECWDLSNLRPLEKIANIKKGIKCLQ